MSKKKLNFVDVFLSEYLIYNGYSDKLDAFNNSKLIKGLMNMDDIEISFSHYPFQNEITGSMVINDSVQFAFDLEVKSYTGNFNHVTFNDLTPSKKALVQTFKRVLGVSDKDIGYYGFSYPDIYINIGGNYYLVIKN